MKSYFQTLRRKLKTENFIIKTQQKRNKFGALICFVITNCVFCVEIIKVETCLLHERLKIFEFSIV